MAQITINIPDNKVAEIINIICLRHGYKVTIDGEPNPETKGEFAKKQIINFIKVQYREAKINTYIASIIDDLKDIT